MRLRRPRAAIQVSLVAVNRPNRAGAVQVVERAAHGFANALQQHRKQLVSRRVLHPREAGNESIEPFGQRFVVHLSDDAKGPGR